MGGKSVTQGWHVVDAVPGPYPLPDLHKFLTCDNRGIDMTHACQVVVGSHLTARCLTWHQHIWYGAFVPFTRVKKGSGYMCMKPGLNIYEKVTHRKLRSVES
jgi:hypothetical protein